MSILCLWSPVWRTGEGSPAELVPLLLEEAPRVAMEAGGIVWVDGRGMPAKRLAERLLERLSESGAAEVKAGLSMIPVAAEAAARSGRERLTIVRPGEEARFLAPLPLTLLTAAAAAAGEDEDDERILPLLEGSGIRHCGELAGLGADAIEVRFGAGGVRLWKLARGDDRRILFRPIPPERPHASVDFVDYTIGDATQLTFVVNAQLDQVCDILRERALRARVITLTMALAGGGTVRESLRTSRPTADRSFWIRRLRATLETIRLPDTIAGVSLEAGASDPVSALQGDLFDRGFTTSAAVEEAMARLMDMHPGLFVRQVSGSHPLAERRAAWEEEKGEERRVGGRVKGEERRVKEGADRDGVGGGGAALALQLLAEPRRVQVRTRARRDHELPVSFRDGAGWRAITAAGPDRVSWGYEEGRRGAREYFRCVSDEGMLLWIYRDAVGKRWYLHGWWD